MKEKNSKLERERLQLQDKVKELGRTVDQLNTQLEESSGKTKQQEQELQDLRQNRDLLSQVLVCELP